MNLVPVGCLILGLTLDTCHPGPGLLPGFTAPPVMQTMECGPKNNWCRAYILPTWGFAVTMEQGPVVRVGHLQDKTFCESVRSILAGQHPEWTLGLCEPDEASAMHFYGRE